MSSHFHFSLNEIIKDWADAHTAAADNARLLLESNHSPKVSAECTECMAALERAETALMLMAVCPDDPSAFKEFIAARKDKGCSTCWFSSRRPEHVDCDAKIRRYFDTQAHLQSYASTLTDTK